MQSITLDGLTLLGAEQLAGSEWRFTVQRTTTTGLWWWKRTHTHCFTVRGSGTVFHIEPSGRRCGTLLEHTLSAFWQRAKWGTLDA